MKQLCLTIASDARGFSGAPPGEAPWLDLHALLAQELGGFFAACGVLHEIQIELRVADHGELLEYLSML